MISRKHLIARIRRFISILVCKLFPQGNVLRVKYNVLRSTYTLWDFKKITDEKRLIKLFCQNSADCPGLADRIKAFLGCYVIAEENGYRFYIYHDAGFNLTDYLEPNEVDWRIEKKDIQWGLNRFKIIWSTTHLEPLNKRHSEYHPHYTYEVIENVPDNLKQKYGFSETFNKLFKPTPHLRNLIDKAYQELNLVENEYIAVHIRFLNFFEAVEQNPDETPFISHASEEEQKAMIESVHATLEAIHKANDNMPILLFSDSPKFMSTPHPDYVSQLSGKVGHIYVHGGNQDVIDKAFSDLFTIAGAAKVYSIIGKDTYPSGYCKTAASLGNKPFFRVERILPE